MGRFYPLYVRRSDGKIELVNKHRQKERNEPTAEQLDKAPDANGICDYYREVDIDEQKHLDWRRKLGGMLARDCGLSDRECGYMLVTFPEHYRLYEHVKRAADDSKNVKTVKNHAGGGNDRQDAYLYGHPQGKKKRYRSPADFYPHLLWLATDEEGDPDNCACKICCPEEIDDKSVAALKKDPASSVKREDPADVKKEVHETKQFGTDKPQGLSEDVKASQSDRRTIPEARPPNQQIHSKAPLQSQDQRPVGGPSDSSTFRQGELVWFARGSAWGLGVVASVQSTESQLGPRSSRFTIQPLSHPYKTPPQVTLNDEQLRPWLAWSVPSFTHAALNNLSGLRYDTADWSGIHSGKYGGGDMEVDGSILAAKSIDLSYSPIEPSLANFPEQSVPVAHKGLYLGAEQVSIGDAVRLRNTRMTDILIVTQIISRPIQQGISDSSPQALSGVVREVTLTGDVYTLQQIAATDPSKVQLDSTLPPRIQADLRARNAASTRAKGYATTFTRIQSNAVVATRDVKGRWYEATVLTPILIGREAATAELASGGLSDVGLRMNARLDAAKGGEAEIWRRSRREAFGRAVPDGFILGAVGIEGSGGQQQGRQQGGQQRQQQEPRQQQQVHQQQQVQPQQQQYYQDYVSGSLQAGQDGDVGLDEFMNLDP